MGVQARMRIRTALFVFLIICLLAFSADTQSEFNAAFAAQQRGDLSSAITGYRHLLSEQPNLLPAHINLGQALLEQEQYAEAAAQFRIALTASPNNLQIGRLLGNALILSQNYPAAVEVLDSQHRRYPEDLDVTFLLGEALLHTPDVQRGLPLILGVAKTRRDANAFVLAAVAQLQLLDFEGARHSLESALRIDKQLPGLQTLRGMALAGLNDFDAAKSAFHEALTANPHDTDANLRLAVLLRNDGDLSGAKPLVERALSDDPQSIAARYEFAKLAMAEHRDADAIKALQTVSKAYPQSPKPHLDLAVLYFRLHQPEEGERERRLADERRRSSQTASDPLAPYDTPAASAAASR